jgi:hypothetical protein
LACRREIDAVAIGCPDTLATIELVAIVLIEPKLEW